MRDIADPAERNLGGALGDLEVADLDVGAGVHRYLKLQADGTQLLPSVRRGLAERHLHLDDLLRVAGELLDGPEGGALLRLVLKALACRAHREFAGAAAGRK